MKKCKWCFSPDKPLYEFKYKNKIQKWCKTCINQEIAVNEHDNAIKYQI